MSRNSGRRVVAGEEECAIDACTLAFAVVTADYDEVEGVPSPGEVVLLDFEPVAGALGRLVVGCQGVKHLDHEAFA